MLLMINHIRMIEYLKIQSTFTSYLVNRFVVVYQNYYFWVLAILRAVSTCSEALT